MVDKPKVAFFDFACCEGCQLTVLACEDELLDILGKIEIVNFREAISRRENNYDIAFIEGSITTLEAVERIKKIRERAKILIELGSCAHSGGVNSLKNFYTTDENLIGVYGKDASKYNTIETHPVHDIVKVDGTVYGCPISKHEFLEVVKAALLGRKPQIPNVPMCVECKMAENQCMFLKGKTCLGPVTRAGCGAICMKYGDSCQACRGLVENPNINAHKGVLAEHGLTVEDILNEFKLFNSDSEVKKNAFSK